MSVLSRCGRHPRTRSLETIEVEDGNSAYFVENNCLFRRYEYWFHKKNNIENSKINDKNIILTV